MFVGAANQTSFVDHWIDMPEWGVDRRLWSFYLTFQGIDALHRRVATLQDRLAGIPGLDLVEPRWLHLTLLGTVFADEIDEAALDAMVAAATRLAAARPPFTLSAAGSAPAHDALLLPVTGEPSLGAFRDRLRDAVAPLVGRPLYRLPEPVGGFSPHVTLAYARAATWPPARIEQRLADCEVAPVEFRVDAVSLVRLRRGPDRWTWDRAFRMPLAGDAR